jgi:hypothetical protein
VSDLPIEAVTYAIDLTILHAVPRFIDSSLTELCADAGPPFTSFRVDVQGAVVESQRVWVMAADGSGGTPLAPGTGPSWSPDSRQLVFVGDLQGPGGVETGLFVMGSDGSGIVQLTGPRPAAEEDLSPEWSPDGAYIACTRVALSDTPQATLFVVRPDGSGLRQLTGPTVQGYEPSWSPDGTELVFADGADGQIKTVGLGSGAVAQRDAPG